MIKVKAIVEKESLDDLFQNFQNYSLEKSSIEKKLRKGISDKEEEVELKRRLKDLKVRLIPGVTLKIQNKRKAEN